MLCGFVGGAVSLGRAAGRSCTQLAGVGYDDVWYTWWGIGWVQLGLGAVVAALAWRYFWGVFMVWAPTLLLRILWLSRRFTASFCFLFWAH
ncbi:hypothetical protein QBC33DRAFT_520474 [Phialemonium atrogriseum]|uniref:Uncharacterized protein n=1 Tax=Phialemonium atrogriseum TaxID=1093897 RepID=A0AAJ0FLH2_9PEZI|nr:uncharacterized protein QBC33DRAFT_520474 [Phialemonium atrogriseum]KAK1772182.1 hypothetical protein QBC33DRAFT_520474 [Phialemonium atrogriseum]